MAALSPQILSLRMRGVKGAREEGRDWKLIAVFYRKKGRECQSDMNPSFLYTNVWIVSDRCSFPHIPPVKALGSKVHVWIFLPFFNRMKFVEFGCWWIQIPLMMLWNLWREWPPPELCSDSRQQSVIIIRTKCVTRMHNTFFSKNICLCTNKSFLKVICLFSFDFHAKTNVEPCKVFWLCGTMKILL